MPQETVQQTETPQMGTKKLDTIASKGNMDMPDKMHTIASAAQASGMLKRADAENLDKTTAKDKPALPRDVECSLQTLGDSLAHCRSLLHQLHISNGVDAPSQNFEEEEAHRQNRQ